MGLVHARRAAPREDLMTALLAAHDDGERLSEQELVPLCIAILVAGYEGTSSQIPNFIHTLLQHPQIQQRLRREPSLIAAAVEELLRFVPLASAAMFVHYATQDVQVGETMVRRGEAVFASIGAANHDPQRFARPEVLDLDRDARGHFAFGCGLHACVGASLARVELQEALGALLERLPPLRLAGTVHWKTQSFFRGPTRMPVAW
jgi:cytochrome P450